MININIKEGVHWIDINESWNWVVSRKLEPLTQDAKKMVISLDHCHIMDSEAIILIWNWLQMGIDIHLVNVPDIYFEIINILDLKEQFGAIKISNT